MRAVEMDSGRRAIHLVSFDDAGEPGPRRYRDLREI